MCENTIPQERKDLPADSDRVQAPVVSAGPTDFEGDQVHKHLTKNSEAGITTTVAAKNLSTL